jgi:hypothetical protein
VSYRDPDDRRTGDLPPTEPIGSGGTEPLRPPVVPSSRRRGGTGIPGSLLAIAAGILVVGLVIGFLLGRAGDDEPVARDRTEQGGGGGGGGGQGGGGGGGGGGGQDQRNRRGRARACREALGLSQQIVGTQNQLVENRARLAEAVLSEDAGLIEELNAQADQLLGQITALQEQLTRPLRRCG